MDNKGNKQWVWLALDATTREVVGVYVGARDESAARCLWDCLPPVYRQCAIAYTDFWAAYAAVLPSKRHRAVGKETGKTSYIERLNNTLRQRVSRLVRKTLSFSKSRLESHWCCLVFCSPLQRIITFVALPQSLGNDLRIWGANLIALPLQLGAPLFCNPDSKGKSNPIAH